MQLTALSLALSRIMGGGAWSPLSLFAAGEQGAWYDPSDLSTLYQDAAGTTPVTAVEQRVGLMLDKSQGLVLGSEFLADADSNFTSDTGYYTKEAGWSISGGVLSATNVSIGNACYKAGVLPSNTLYEVTLVINSITSGGVKVFVGAPQPYNTLFSQAGIYKFRVLSGTSGWVGVQSAITSTSADIDRISYKPVLGNHAFQATTTPNDKRPILSARVNLLTKTEQFDDAAWARNLILPFGSGSVANTTATTDPLGGNTADFIVPTTTSSAHFVGQSTTATGIFTFSFYAKAGGYNYCSVANTPNNFVHFDLTNGSISTLGTGWGNASCTLISNGWYRCSVTNSASQSWLNVYIYALNSWLSSGNSIPTFAGDGTSGVYIWGADLRPSNIGNNIPAYQRVNTATDYDTTGFPYYLKADGTYTSMSTNSINFSATDKLSYFTALRGLYPSTGVVIELSNSGFTNAGGFYLSRSDTTNNYGFADQNSYYSVTKATPSSDVLSCNYDLSKTTKDEEIIPRINTVVSQSGGAGTGSATGNFGNYPLYLFARNNASLFFNGQFYGAIIRGATTSGTDLTNAESYMNTQSGGLY